MNYDDQILGVGNPNHPANQIEVDPELTREQELENEVEELRGKLEMTKHRDKWRDEQLKKLGGIWQNRTTFGDITADEIKIIDEILEPYLPIK